MRHPLASLFISIGLALGNWFDARARIAAPPLPKRLTFGTDPVQSVDFWPAISPHKALQQTDFPPSPLIVFVHGGGWSLGTKDNATGRAKIAHFTTAGIAFATVGYRLVPDARVEDQATDVANAFALLLANADRLSIDRRRVVLMGHSAGAHLVALLGTDPRWLREAGSTFDAIAGIVAIDGAAYDVPQQMRDSPMLLRPLYRQAFGTDPARQRALSPVWQAGAPNVANWLLLHVDRVDGTLQTAALAAALRRAGSTADVIALPGRGLFGHVASNRRLGDSAYPGTRAADLWLDRILVARILAARFLASA